MRAFGDAMNQRRKEHEADKSKTQSLSLSLSLSLSHIHTLTQLVNRALASNIEGLNIRLAQPQRFLVAQGPVSHRLYDFLINFLPKLCLLCVF
jgi:hypothetical protein